jgi:hypothetical protein
MTAEQRREFQEIVEQQKRLNEQQKRLGQQLAEMDQKAQEAIAHIRSGEAAPAPRVAEPTAQAAEITAPAANSGAQGRSVALVGHWRTTSVGLGRVRDDHMVLRADGSAEKWSVTAQSRGSSISGRWSSQGSTLNVNWSDGTGVSQPFTMYQGQLVLPNLQGRRRFWDRVQ